MSDPSTTSKDPPAQQPAAPETPAPMTATLMARLFVVPAVIVCLLLGVAVVVVLFGSTSIDKPESISDLLARLEADSGERTAGAMLMPKAKDSWQAAQELAQRLSNKEKFLKPEDVGPTAGRIIALLEKFPAGQDVDEQGPAKQYFLMLALGRLGTESAVEPLTKLLKDPNSSTRRVALQSIAELKGSDAGRLALPHVLPLLSDSKTAVQMVACATVASIAERGSTAAIKAVADRLESDREVQWNAAMTLARLGDPRGKLVLMNMLDRSYWEKIDLEYGENGSTIRRKYTEAEISNNLRSAIEAASFLQDAELTNLVGRLQKDSSVMVRDAARAATAKMATKQAVWSGKPLERFAVGPAYRGEVS